MEEKKEDASNSEMEIIPLKPCGDWLTELFSVYIIKKEEYDTINLHGTIKITNDDHGVQIIYSRKGDDCDDCESIGTGATTLLRGAGLLQWLNNFPDIEEDICMLTLTGPSICILATGSFVIEVDLWDSRTKKKAYETKWFWNVISHDWTLNGVVLCDKIDGKYGPLRMDIAVFDEALQATVEVTLIHRNGKEQADVYGVVAKQDNRLPNREIVLFQREQYKRITVRAGAQIPLLRSVVVVPVESVLRVMADLCDYSSISALPEIVKGTAEFKPQLSGTYAKKNITGNGGEIEVKVTWVNVSMM